MLVSVITYMGRDGCLKWMLQQSKARSQELTLQLKTLTSGAYDTVCHLILPCLGKYMIFYIFPF